MPCHVRGQILADPQVPVVVPDNVLRGELLHVDEGLPRKGGEDEDVADSPLTAARGRSSFP